MILDLIRLMLNHKALGNSPTKENQRVLLNPRQTPSHPTLPYRGSPHECEGTVERIICDAAIVRWDNGESGSFEHQGLTVCDFPFRPNPFQFYPNFDAKNPNITFKRWKMKMFGEGGAKRDYIFTDDMEAAYYKKQELGSVTKMLTRGYAVRQ